MKNRSNEIESGQFEYKIILCPVREESHAFQKRFSSVQGMIIRMIAKGRKKGRPSLKDCEYEDAA